MNLKEYLTSIGREKKEPENINDEAPEPVETLPELRTIGDIFDYYKKKDAKHLPDGIIINSDRWKSKLIHTLVSQTSVQIL